MADNPSGLLMRRIKEAKQGRQKGSQKGSKPMHQKQAPAGQSATTPQMAMMAPMMARMMAMNPEMGATNMQKMMAMMAGFQQAASASKRRRIDGDGGDAHEV